MTSPTMTRAAAGYRSVLFAPGNNPRRVAKVFQCGADVAILDLEDAVPIAEKESTRLLAVEALNGERDCAGYVRVNSFDTPWCYGDLVGVVHARLDGIVLPKAETADQLRTVDWVIGNLERERGLPAGSIDLMPIIETARGVMALETLLAATPRVRRVAFGGGDYTLDLDLQWTIEESEFAFARARLVHCSRAAGLEAPIDTVLLQIRDSERFQSSARLARRLGFQGKLCIHPDQVPLANAAFAPTVEEIAHAKAVIAAFEVAERQGSASIQLDGLFIDYPIAYKARRVLAIAAASGMAAT
jgi:citrate lyase subunit beta / citryl-CoA lyase